MRLALRLADPSEIAAARVIDVPRPRLAADDPATAVIGRGRPAAVGR
jgi:hypothetical protein